jgi:hypothetical protein
MLPPAAGGTVVGAAGGAVNGQDGNVHSSADGVTYAVFADDCLDF